MSGFHWILVAIGFAAGAIVGVIAGGFSVLAAFLRMHHNTLPPDRRPKSIWRSP